MILLNENTELAVLDTVDQMMKIGKDVLLHSRFSSVCRQTYITNNL